MESLLSLSMEKGLENKWMKKDILIISYKFSPMGGIGTRRWAKFAKYFTRIGYRVHILTIDYPYVDEVNWEYDIKGNKNIVVHRIKSGYPIWLMKLSKNSFIAFFQKSINFVLKRTIFYIDIAQNWAKYMLPKAEQIIKDNNIENVIITSPPHSIAYYATYLKVDLPYINLIQDFRDNWNDDTPYSYPNTLKFFWQKEKSAYMEWFVVNHSDYIVNVTQDITDRAKNKFKQYRNKFITIYNGFDNNDIQDIDTEAELNSDNIRIVYAGGLGLGRIEAVKLIFDFLLEQTKEVLKRFKINIFTSYNKNSLDSKYNILFENKIVSFNSLVSPQKIFRIINEHEYCLSINSPIYSYAFGTKIFDYMMLNKKIIHISNGGELSRILTTQGQYVARYNIEDIKKVFNQLLRDKNHMHNINYDKFDIYNLTKEYEKLLNNKDKEFIND